MRRIFIVITIILALVFILGIISIIGRLLSKTKKEKHYVFTRFEDEKYHGYKLTDDYQNVVFEAVRTGIGEKYATYEFSNLKKRFSYPVIHDVSGMGITNNAPNLSHNSFLFDETDIWEYLEKRGLTLRTTIVDDKLTQYRFQRGIRTIAYARKKNSNTEEYGLRTSEKKLETLFIALFAISRTERANKRDLAKE